MQHAKLAEFADYQLASGGFVLPMMRIPSTDATRKGLFVSALFGLDVCAFDFVSLRSLVFPLHKKGSKKERKTEREKSRIQPFPLLFVMICFFFF